MKYLKFVILTIVLAFAIYGFFSLYKLWVVPKSKEEVSSVVVLDRVEKVFKLVTVEGNFSELYDYKHHFFADIWPFRKKALIRVKARVMVGYDFEKLTINIDEKSKTISISGPIEPRILSIEHDLDYYNFESGLFNLITNRDITVMSARAKQFIEDKAMESDLFDQAEAQRSEIMELLRLSLEASGWSLKVNEGIFLN